MNQLQRSLLFSILAYSLIVRLIGIPWGMPLFDKDMPGSARYHPDEFKITQGARNFPQDIFTRTDLRYPTAFHYMIGVIGLPLKLLGKAQDDLQNYALLGRLMSAFFGVASIYLSFLLTKQIASIKAGLIAAALLAVSLYHVRESSVSTTDIATSFWALVILILAAKATPNPGWKTFLVAGIVSGILIGTKYSGAFILIPFAIWLGDSIRKAPAQNRRNLLLRIGVFCAALLITFLLTTPTIVLNPSAFFNSLSYESQRVAKLRSAWWDPAILFFFFTSLAEATNPFICITITGALIFAAIKRPNIHLIAYTIFILTYYLYFNTAFATRYWTLALPPAAVLTGWALEKISSAPNKLGTLSTTVILALCLATGLYQNYQLAHLLLNDTRSAAARYIQQLPANATFLLSLNSAKADGWQYPSIHQPTAKNISEIPGYIVLSDMADDLPENGVLDVQTNNQNVHYQQIAIFKPVENLQVEFLSPVIEIFKLDNQPATFLQ